MTEARVEVRQYMSTIKMFFNEDGDLVGEEDQNASSWYDTLENRPMTDDEKKDWL